MLKAIAAMIGFKTVQKITEGGADQQFVTTRIFGS
jgi:hypothetical protein